MFSPHSPTLSGAHNLREHQTGYLHYGQLNGNNLLSNYPASFSTTTTSGGSSSRNMSPPLVTATHHNNNNNNQHQHHHLSPSLSSPKSSQTSIQCLRFKYFTTFFVCTTCLALLAASLATHKWLVSKPIRHLRLNNGQRANFTALMLTAAHEDTDKPDKQQQQLANAGSNNKRANPPAQTTGSPNITPNYATSHTLANDFSGASFSPSGANLLQQTTGNKFQGEIYFGLFNGVKVLNYGFGDRVSQLSVTQTFWASTNKDNPPQQSAPGEPLINYKFWLITLIGVILAILFALVGSIFAIINFVMTPRGTMTGPVGLVIWNAAASFSCLLAIVAWLVEYFLRLKSNVLTSEEAQNGWTSENRSQFGYSYYFVVLAFVLHLVNIFIVSIVQSETWTNNSATSCSKSLAKRQARLACDGVIMLY